LAFYLFWGIKLDKRKPYNKKRFEWKLYHIKDDLYFFQTYNQGPTLRTAPDLLRPLFAHKGPVGHTYYKGSKEGYITSYLLRSNEFELRDIAKNSGKKLNIRSAHNNHNRDLGLNEDVEFNIFSRYTIGLENLENNFYFMIRDDVVEFCKRKGSETIQNGDHYKRVDKIEPDPKFTLITPKINELIKAGKGFFDNGCIIYLGMDFSRGCVSNITPDGWYDLESRCNYCYAYQNGPSFLETLLDFDKNLFIDRFEGKIEEVGLKRNKTLYVRMGQTTEVNTPEPIRSFSGFVDNLKIALNALVYLSEKYDIRIALPTKIPDFDEETINLFKKLNISILASIGYRELEKGIINLGYPTEKRLENILKLGKMGLNASVYVATNITNHNLMQNEAINAIDFFEKHKEHLNLQFLDMRITNKRIAESIGGAPWSQLVRHSQKDLFFEEGKWGRTGQNYLHALTTDPYFLKLVGDNKGKVRICSTHVEDHKRCGQCFMDNVSE